MAQSVETKLRGLFTNFNNLSEAPKASIVIGDNIVLDRDGILEPRRGFDSLLYKLPHPDYRSEQLLKYQNFMIAHYGTGAANKLAYYDSTAEIKTGLTLNSGTNTISMADTSNISLGQTVYSNEVAIVTCVGDVAGSLNNTYFLISSANDTNDYYVWFNVSGGGTDPNVQNRTGIEVAITTGDNANTVAAALQAIMNPEADFDASVLGADVTITRAAAGTSFPAYDGSGSYATGFSFSNPGDGVQADTFVTNIVVNTNVTLSKNLNLNRSNAIVNFEGFREYAGSYLAPDASLGRIRSALANLNFYFCTDSGVKRLDAIYNVPVASGGIKALEAFASLTDIAGFMSNNTKVAYRIVWGYKDENNNLILGSPSQRTVISNTNGYSTNVQLVISIPEGITEDHFYQVYRSGLSISADVEPSDELSLVAENNPSAAEILAKSLTIVDTTPESLTGADLYTNSSQEGIAQSNDPPPFAKDLAVFRNSLFLANTRSKHRLELTLLGVSGEFDITGDTYIVDAIKNTVYNLKIEKTGTISNGSNLVTGLNNIEPLVLGQGLSGSGIPDDTVISSFNTNTSLTMSQNATAGGSITISFELVGITIGQIISGTGIPADTQVLDVFDETTTTGDTSGTGTTITSIPSTAEFKVGQPISGTGIPTNTFILTVNNSTTVTLTKNLDGSGAPNTLLTLGNGVRMSNDATATNTGITVSLKNGTSGFQVDDTVTIAGTTYTAKKQEDISSLEFKLYAQGTPAQNIDDSVRSLVRVINQNSTNTNVYAYYISSTASQSQSIANLLPGKFLIEERNIGGSSFSATASAHGTAFNPTLPTSGTNVESENDEFKNGLYYSKLLEPEAFPLTNYIRLGSADKAILRIVPLRDALFVFKEDGVYRVTGTDALSGFRADLLDNTANLIAPESAVALNNQILMFSDQGIAAVTDTGVSVLSRPIELDMIRLLSFTSDVLKTQAFGVAYESERKYLISVPTNSSDTTTTQVYVYNIFTEAWTRWPISKTCGVVNDYDGKLYMGASDSNKVNIERKSRNYTDYADDEFDITIVSSSDKDVVLNSVVGISTGDLLYQANTVASVIDSIDATTSTVTVRDTIPWVPGPAKILEAIQSIVKFIPQVGGNAGVLKQFREISLFIKDASFFQKLQLDFDTELSVSSEPITFSGYGQALWGLFAWGLVPWGGSSSVLNVRTYVPRNKQKCSQLNIKLTHREAYSYYSLQGFSLIYNLLSERLTR